MTKKKKPKNKAVKTASGSSASTADSKESAGSDSSGTSSDTKTSEAGRPYTCVHCSHEFRFDGEDDPTRCPSCMRKGGIEAAHVAPEGRPSWMIPAVVAACVLGAAGVYAATSAEGRGESAGEIPLTPLSANDLAAHLREGGADPELAEVMQGGEAAEALAEHATGSTAAAKLEALHAYIQQRRDDDGYALLSLDMPREMSPHDAEWAAAALASDEETELYPLEVAFAAVAALREADVPAMVAELWFLEDTRRPPDPSGQMGYFGVALVDEGGDASYTDVYAGETVDSDSARVLNDVQAVAAYLSLRGLQRLVHENDSVRAMGDVQRALRLDERSPYIRTARGTILTQSGGIEEGVRELEAAANLRRDAPRSNNLGGLFIALERYDDADQAITSALEEQPDFAFAHANLAVIHMSRGESSDAFRQLERAERLEPTLHVLPLLMAQYYLSERDSGSAERWVQRAIERQPRSVQTHLAAAQIYGSLGESDKMRREVQATLELVPAERRDLFRQEIRARLGASALEEPDDLGDFGGDDLGDELGGDELGDLGDLGDLGGLGLGGGGGGGLLGGGDSGGPSLLDGDLGGGGDFDLGGGGGGDLQLRDPSGGDFQLRLGQ
ncbi:MAG: hypothetical protein AB8H86_28590 [Polyangiales bacterium]